MALSDLAAGVEVTAEQRERGVRVVDATHTTLEARLEPFVAELPCNLEAAAAILEARVRGCETITASAHEAGVVPITAAKVLYLLGEPVVAFDTNTNEALARWLEAECSWTDAVATAKNRERFVLAAYIATHEPIPGASRVVAEAFSTPDR